MQGWEAQWRCHQGVHRRIITLPCLERCLICYMVLLAWLMWPLQNVNAAHILMDPVECVCDFCMKKGISVHSIFCALSNGWQITAHSRASFSWNIKRMKQWPFISWLTMVLFSTSVSLIPCDFHSAHKCIQSSGSMFSACTILITNFLDYEKIISNLC